MNLYEKVRRLSLPVVLYGMGDGADKLLSVLAAKDIPVAGVFASDEFVRGQSFRGYPVRTYAETKAAYGTFTVLVAFASPLPAVLANVERIAAEMPLFIPDLPVCGTELFDEAYYGAHREECGAVRGLLADEISRALFDEMIEYRLSGEMAPLFAHTAQTEELYSFFRPETYRIALDLGAYTGDTARELLSRAPGLERLVCMEPDPRSCKKLRALAQENPVIEAHALGAWSERCDRPFIPAGGRGARAGTEKKSVLLPFEAPDRVLGGRKCDYIKFDVEGAEAMALCGCRETVLRDAPDIRLSLYHRREDLFSLPQLLHSMQPRYEFHLRRGKCFPAWELDLLATARA